ncbi:hypothetical protein [Halosimplex halobium]|uniref:hypothetical protein n=1 Tax=Halosimplex halobium TaxID=3396618 RepID=UPI003F5584CF
MSVLLPAVLSLALASVHVLTRSDPILDRLSEGRLLSFGGGVSVAYVLVHVLPRIDEFHAPVERHPMTPVPSGRDIYLVVVVGFVVFYGLERLARRSAAESGDDRPTPWVFRVHVASYGAYNAVAGYPLVHRETPAVGNLLLFAFALGAHFLLNDVALEAHHREAYHRRGRWVLAAAVLAGTAVGFATELTRPTLGALFAFLAGGVVLNVVREELPGDRRGEFLPFAAGVAFYTAVILFV